MSQAATISGKKARKVLPRVRGAPLGGFFVRRSRSVPLAFRIPLRSDALLASPFQKPPPLPSPLLFFFFLFFPPRIAKDQPSVQIVIHLDRFPFRDSNFNSRGSTWTQIFPQSMNSWFFFLLIQSY